METFLRWWAFVWGFQWSLVNSPHRDHWCGALLFSLICAWLDGWVNNHEAGDLRRHHAHYDVIVILMVDQCVLWFYLYYYVVQDFACGCPLAPQLQDIGRHSAVCVCVRACVCVHTRVRIYMQEQQDCDWWSSWSPIDAITCNTNVSVSYIGSLFKNPGKQVGVCFDQ